MPPPPTLRRCFATPAYMLLMPLLLMLPLMLRQRAALCVAMF